MTRREFLRNAFGMMCGVALNQFIEPFGRAAAGYRPIEDETGKNIEGIAIAETNLIFGKLDYRPVTNSIVIHHIGNTDKDVCAADVHKWHLARGWSGIGYHYLIRKDGTIERGRPRDMVGAHCFGENEHTLGINLVGNFEMARPTSAQLDSACVLVAGLCRLYSIPPSFFTIRGHRDYNNTACPGYYLYNELPQILAMVAKNVQIDRPFADKDNGHIKPQTPGTRRRERSEAQEDNQRVLPRANSLLKDNEHTSVAGGLNADNIRPIHRFEETSGIK